MRGELAVLPEVESLQVCPSGSEGVSAVFFLSVCPSLFDMAACSDQPLYLQRHKQRIKHHILQQTNGPHMMTENKWLKLPITADHGLNIMWSFTANGNTQHQSKLQ